MTPRRPPEDSAGLGWALRLGMGVELVGTPEEVRRAVRTYWRAGLEAPCPVVARAIAKLLDMGERPGQVTACPACGAPLCLWSRGRSPA
jgi:hypothetical protein